MSVSRENLARIERALDGRLSDAELDALQAEIIRDPALRAAYVERAWLEGALRADRESLRTLTESAPAAGRRVVKWPLWAGAGLLAAAAAGVAIAFKVLPARRASAADAPVATLVQSQNAKWAGSSLPTMENSKLGRGTLALVEGIVTLRFNSGATVTLEAPSRLEVLSAMQCRLIEGSVTADVPPSAHGFTIDTADLKVVDLGTRFGVTAGSAGNSHVFVFEGEVTLNRPNGEPVRNLTEGKAFHVASGATAGSVEPARFPQVQHVDGWTSIPTSFGRGKDAFARRGHSTSAGQQPLLMVKHSELESSLRNERRAVLTFDISEVRTREVREVELMLDPEPSGMGFTAMVPDSRFTIYAVKEGSGADDWDEASLVWDNFPACTDAGVQPGQVIELGAIAIPRGGSGEPITLRSNALAPFLQSDTNGLVTFLIVRETGETHSSGLVHAFASKEHPTARPPTLRIR